MNYEELLIKTCDYISNVKPHAQNFHSYLCHVKITSTEYKRMRQIREHEGEYVKVQPYLEVINNAKEIIISNIIQMHILNPYNKNSALALKYLSIISKEFKDDTPDDVERVNLIFNGSNGPISIKGRK